MYFGVSIPNCDESLVVVNFTFQGHSLDAEKAHA